MQRNRLRMTKRSSLAKPVWDFVSDQRGAEVTELAVVLGLMVAGAVLLVITLGGTISGFYTSLNSQLP